MLRAAISTFRISLNLILEQMTRRYRKKTLERVDGLLEAGHSKSLSYQG